MRSRVQVSLPLPTKNQALASTQVLFFYPFSGFTTKFPPPLQRIAAASVHRVPPTRLQKNSKKIAKNQPYASARRLCGSLWREPLWALRGHLCGSFWRAFAGTFLGSLCSKPQPGASAGPLEGASLGPLRAPLREFLGSLCGNLFGESLFEASARHLLGSFLGSLCGHFFLGGACSKPLLGTFWRTFGAPLEEPLGGAFGEPLRETFFGGACSKPLLGTFAGATKNPSSKDGFHTQTLTIQTMQWLNFLLFVSDTKVGQNASWDNRHN